MEEEEEEEDAAMLCCHAQACIYNTDSMVLHTYSTAQSVTACQPAAACCHGTGIYMYIYDARAAAHAACHAMPRHDATASRPSLFLFYGSHQLVETMREIEE